MAGEATLRSVTAVEKGLNVLACETLPHRRARLAEALRGRGRIQFVESLAQVIHQLRVSTETVDVVVLPSTDEDGAEAVRTICHIVAERPHVAVVAYCRAGSQYSTDIRALVAAGVHQFIFAGIDDTGIALRAVLDAARRQCAAEWVMNSLAPIVPASLHPMIDMALARPHAITTIPELARGLGVHRKTLFNRCERAAFLTPAELLTWVRLCLVAHLLATTGCTVETIAIELAFASDTALRNAMKRYTGYRPSEIRSNGGLRCVLEALVTRIRQSSGRPRLHQV